MSTTIEDSRADTLLQRLDSVLDELSTLGLTSHSDDEVLELLSGLEARKRRLATVDHAIIGEVEDRGLGRERGCKRTSGLLVQLLRISAGKANARVRAAKELAPRRGLTGQPMPPVFPQVAAAQAAGTVSEAQARVITRAISQLPDEVRDREFDQVEGFLVEQAQIFGPDCLNTIARRIIDTLDPDGKLRDAKHRDRTRHLTVQQREDGSAFGSFDLTALCAEALLAVLDVTAAPKPEADGVKDQRSLGQRNHDGLYDALKLALRSGGLPTCNGVSATMVFTMTDQQSQTGEGFAYTGHGTLIPTCDALTMLGDARAMTVRFGENKNVEAYSSLHRIFTEGQRLAMAARDLGCSFPGCTTKPPWCEAHHVTDFAATRKTTIADGTLLCGHHHREHTRLGWTGTMINGYPHWIPPAWLDHTRTPRRNHAHNPLQDE